MDNISADFVRDLIETRQKTTAEALEIISNTLAAAGIRNLNGFSLRSLERFMSKNRISRHGDDNALDDMVRTSANVLGGSTGAKMVEGYVRSRFGRSIGRHRIARSLRRIDPVSAAARHHATNRLINPKTYHGRYFGYNLHMDQNEKLTMFGVTLVMAMDGFSGMVVGAAVMEIKNNIIIYEKVFRRIVSKYGLWRRVIVDHGKEFFLTLNMQMALHHEMGYVDEDDLESVYKQTTSKKNNRIERLWVGVNQQVMYPIKYGIAEMVQQDVIDPNEDYQRFSVGEVIRPLVHFGLKTWINMWNNHLVPKRGRPIELSRDAQNLLVDDVLLVSGDEAADRYRQEGGTLTDEREAPGDLLQDHPDERERRDRRFWDQELPLLRDRVLAGHFGPVSQGFVNAFSNRSVLEMIFGATTNRMYRPLQEAILLHIRLSVTMFNDMTAE